MDFKEFTVFTFFVHFGPRNLQNHLKIGPGGAPGGGPGGPAAAPGAFP